MVSLVDGAIVSAPGFAIGVASGVAIGAAGAAAAPESDIGPRGDADIGADDACCNDFSFNAFVSADALLVERALCRAGAAFAVVATAAATIVARIRFVFISLLLAKGP